MDVQIKTKNLRLTDSLEAYIRGRVAKLDRVEERVVDAKFEVHPEHNRTGGEQMVAQFTIATRDSILRTEEKNHDLHIAIDLAVDRMSRQIKRFHDKRVFARRRRSQLLAEQEPAGLLSPNGGPAGEVAEDDDEMDLSDLVRRKRFKIQPMSEEEAIEHMELLGHDFYVFFNPDEAQINVLYRRRDGRYGLLQPDLI